MKNMSCRFSKLSKQLIIGNSADCRSYARQKLKKLHDVDIIAIFLLEHSPVDALFLRLPIFDDRKKRFTAIITENAS